MLGKRVDMHIHEYIQFAHIPIPRFARRCGVSKAAVIKWYYGQRAPEDDTKLKIARVTGGLVSVEEQVRMGAAIIRKRRKARDKERK